jgi:hypothetical protein
MTEITERTMIPAHPEWFVAVYVKGGTDKETGETWEDCFHLHPIVAWEIEYKSSPYHPIAKRDSRERVIHRWAHPICFDWDENLANPWMVKDPSGFFRDPENGFAKEADALKHCAEVPS